MWRDRSLFAVIAVAALSLLLWGTLGLFPAVHAQDATPEAAEEAAPDAAANPETVAPPLLEGTIIANRTDVVVTFFLDGETYTIQPQRSLGVQFPRDTSVLNLYNCEAGTGTDSDDCFWDPYLLRKDGFYEVITDAPGDGASLLLQDAMTPPGDQIWLHNRTGAQESVYYSGGVYQLGPGTTTEIVLVGDDTTIYRRNCLELDGRSVCEWRAQEVVGGVYYALSSVETAGRVADSRRIAVGLAPVLAKDTAVFVASNEPEVASVTCALNVLTLNVRAGPSVDYLVLAKLRQSDLGNDLVNILGRAAQGEWLAVEDAIAPGGWISGNDRYVTCAGDVDALPVAEVADGRLAPTPVPQVARPAAPAPEAEAEAEATPEPESAEPTAVSGPPPGQVRLVVVNSFGQVIRFTYDNKEYDMQPGEQAIIDTFPGQIAFSASSPWQSTSGNADFDMLPDETRVLYVRWEQEIAGGPWVLKFD